MMAAHHPSCVNVSGPNVLYKDDFIFSEYTYRRNEVKATSQGITVTPKAHHYRFRTSRKVPKVGVLLVGWGGNNGTTVTAGILANKHKLSWHTKEGEQFPNYFGSLTQASTVRIGADADTGKEVNVPFNSLLPMVHPNDIVIGGWDINGANLFAAMKRAKVLDYSLQQKLRPYMEKQVPLPSIYYPSFIAANQEGRANNHFNDLTKADNKKADLERIREDIRAFKKEHAVDTCIVLWTANTERFTDVSSGVNTSANEILASIESNHSEISPSNIFAVASILEQCPYINGSPQNTLNPGIIDLATQHNVFVGGDDFKSGQTKMKSVLVDFLVNAGIKVESIVSYNHLGNNDGKNLSAPAQFKSKEISKSNVVDDMVEANHILYGPKKGGANKEDKSMTSSSSSNDSEDEQKGDHPDHVVVIKYVPYVGDSKRAMDEYVSSIFMNGHNTIVMHNTCEDSLLASPLIIDLVVLAELMTRISYTDARPGQEEDSAAGTSKPYVAFHPVLSVLSYLLKAPVVPNGTPVVNALQRQHRCIVNILRVCAGIPPETDMLLEYKAVQGTMPTATDDVPVQAAAAAKY